MLVNCTYNLNTDVKIVLVSFRVKGRPFKNIPRCFQDLVVDPVGPEAELPDTRHLFHTRDFLSTSRDPTHMIKQKKKIKGGDLILFQELKELGLRVCYHGNLGLIILLVKATPYLWRRCEM